MSVGLIIGLTVGAVVMIVGTVLGIVAYATKQNVKVGAIVAVTGLAVLIIVGAAGAHSNHQKEVAASRSRSMSVKQAKTDNKKFGTARDQVLAGAYIAASAAEKLGNKISKAWNSAIFDDGGATVAGKKYTDFNDAIQAVLDSDTDNDAAIESGEDQMNTGLAIMQKRVTKKNRQKLSDAKDVVNAVKKLDTIVQSPTGNISTFNSNFSDADSEAASLISD